MRVRNIAVGAWWTSVGVLGGVAAHLQGTQSHQRTVSVAATSTAAVGAAVAFGMRGRLGSGATAAGAGLVVAATLNAAHGTMLSNATRPEPLDIEITPPSIDRGPATYGADPTVQAARERMAASATGRHIMDIADTTGVRVDALDEASWKERFSSFDFAAGVFTGSSNAIYLRPGRIDSDNEAAHVLAHELVHAIDSGTGLPSSDREARAYLAGETVARELGVACARSYACDQLTHELRSYDEVRHRVDISKNYGRRAR